MSLLLLYIPTCAEYWYDTGPDPDQLGRDQDVTVPPHFAAKEASDDRKEAAAKAIMRGKYRKEDEELILLFLHHFEDFDD